jgi:hypothetical protein
MAERRARIRRGEAVEFVLDAERLHVFAAETGLAIA